FGCGCPLLCRLLRCLTPLRLGLVLVLEFGDLGLKRLQVPFGLAAGIALRLDRCRALDAEVAAGRGRLVCALIVDAGIALVRLIGCGLVVRHRVCAPVVSGIAPNAKMPAPGESRRCAFAAACTSKSGRCQRCRCVALWAIRSL